MSKQLQKSINEKYLKITETDMAKSLVERMPEHKEMIELINKNIPEIKRASSLFGKHQSHFMDAIMSVAHYTPLRNMRQILAQITKSREAIEENNIRLRKKEIKLKMKKRDFESEKDELRKEMIQTEIDELSGQIENAKLYLSGAIRSVSNYTEQYNSIANKYGIVEFNEEDFENEEERYHITKAFEQAYCAAIGGRGGFDEGNMIYVTQIGINGHVAQKDLQEYLILEDSLLKDGKEPTHKMFQMFLERMAEKHKGCSKNLLDRKGMSAYSKTSLLKTGDKSLFEKKKPANHIEKMKKLYRLSTDRFVNGPEQRSAEQKLYRLLEKHKMTIYDIQQLL